MLNCRKFTKKGYLKGRMSKKISDLSKSELITKVLHLQEENESLRDEADSLWMMLDELTKSDIENWSHLLAQLEMKVAESTLMATKKKADC